MRKFILILFFLAIGLAYLFEIDEAIARKLSFFNDIKQSYTNKIVNISFTIEKYFNQISRIETLEKENERLKKFEIIHQSSLEKLNELKNVSEQLKNTDSLHSELIRVTTYENFNDYTKVILDYEKKDNEISALITTDNFAAGIAIKEDNQTIGLLNGNKKCSYAVYIGENKTPGIVNFSKKKKQYVFINYIPIWQEIKVGDEVITSGMDNIFYEGVKVGKIVEIEKYPTMQKAYIKPYANILKEKYYFIYSNNLP